MFLVDASATRRFTKTLPAVVCLLYILYAIFREEKKTLNAYTNHLPVQTARLLSISKLHSHYLDEELPPASHFDLNVCILPDD